MTPPGTPSNPAMRYPNCPRCAVPVETTYLDEGVRYPPSGISAEYRRAMYDDLEHPLWRKTVRSEVASLADDGYIGPGELLGAPERDVLTLTPCKHQLVGAAAHRFNTDAANPTWPDLEISITVTVPAALSGQELPRHLTQSSASAVSEVRVDGPDAIARRILNAANLIIDAVHR